MLSVCLPALSFLYAAVTLKKQTLAAAKKQTNDAGSKTLGWLRDATAGGARTTSARQVALNSKNNSDPRCCPLSAAHTQLCVHN